MTFTIKEQVHVDIRIDGVTIEEDFAPGDHDLPDAIADLLVSQGIAAPSTKKSKISPVIVDPEPTPEA